MFKIKTWIIFTFMTVMARADIIRLYGREFYSRFVQESRKELRSILNETPDIGRQCFQPELSLWTVLFLVVQGFSLAGYRKGSRVAAYLADQRSHGQAAAKVRAALVCQSHVPG